MTWQIARTINARPGQATPANSSDLKRTLGRDDVVPRSACSLPWAALKTRSAWGGIVRSQGVPMADFFRTAAVAALCGALLMAAPLSVGAQTQSAAQTDAATWGLYARLAGSERQSP